MNSGEPHRQCQRSARDSRPYFIALNAASAASESELANVETMCASDFRRYFDPRLCLLDLLYSSPARGDGLPHATSRQRNGGRLPNVRVSFVRRDELMGRSDATQTRIRSDSRNSRPEILGPPERDE